MAKSIWEMSVAELHAQYVTAMGVAPTPLPPEDPGVPLSNDIGQIQPFQRKVQELRGAPSMPNVELSAIAARSSVAPQPSARVVDVHIQSKTEKTPEGRHVVVFFPTANDIISAFLVLDGECLVESPINWTIGEHVHVDPRIVVENPNEVRSNWRFKKGLRWSINVRTDSW